MCGAPFSGKTTLARSLAVHTNSKYLSLDDIMRQRGRDLSQLQPVEEWGKAHEICLQLMDELMQEHVSIVLDDTNNLRWLRDRFRQLAQQHQYNTSIIFLDIPLAELEKRREQVRHSKQRNYVPDEVFYPFMEYFERPDTDEHPLIFDGTLDMHEWMRTCLI
ncbi:AAA family ATPase [Dictyobacter kobayashii]|uniref:ATP-binding protein n=1 Tax=Dictyobacter kobayashii TaxID=2014872 RepID=A0A402AR31_9CHLR|nr:ATP-binding protein [Dictyobacter kobayashii]GCE21533.1 hypothetical protein KDK_53330 [Dictyobacter kobayashii]